ncbi:hypothetical protein KKD19_02595 [Patescibacteria group bacterium]|nr:hypothetical protein [Patescibacteria group bacterium]MBU4512108.1 hypothetical protein [Patescibacteria group bacterium]MCG2693123.1 hypothetical protein [Candidatus Parcubacteria bacterium]
MEQEQNIIKDSNAPILTKKPRKKNLLLKVLGGAVLIFSLFFLLGIMSGGCPEGLAWIVYGEWYFIIIGIFIVQLVLSIIRIKKLNVLDRILLIVNCAIIIFYYFTVLRNCIWD